VSIRTDGARPIRDPPIQDQDYEKADKVPAVRSNHRRLRVIRLLLRWQGLAAVGAGLVGLLVAGPVAGYSALLGGLTCWLPNCWFAYRAFRSAGARAANAIVHDFYKGLAGKTLLTGALFALVFSQVRPIAPLAVFLAFIAVQFVNWVVPIVADRRAPTQ